MNTAARAKMIQKYRGNPITRLSKSPPKDIGIPCEAEAAAAEADAVTSTISATPEEG